jgi:hypothetical protein
MLGDAAAASGSAAPPYWTILLFGAGAMLMLAVLQYLRWRREEKRLFSFSFLKAYGLIMVATLGAVLVLTDVQSEARTGAFTLLGTIAGYLATTPGGDGQGPVRSANQDPAGQGKQEG